MQALNKTRMPDSFDRIASTTGLASPIGIGINNSNTPLYGFVFNKILQLVESPSMHPFVISGGFPNVPQVFHHNSISRFKPVNNGLANIVVSPSLETSPSASTIFKFLLGRFRAFALKLRSGIEPFLDKVFIALKELIMGSDGKIIYSQVNPNNLTIATRNIGIDLSGECDVDKESLFSFNDFGSLITPIKILPIIFGNFYGDFNSAVNCCKPYLVKTKSECSAVEGEGETILEDRLGALIGSDRFKSLGCQPISIYNKLRWKIEALSGFIIAKMVKLISVIYFRFESLVGYVRNHFGISFHSLKNKFIIGKFKLYSSNGLHRDYIDEIVYKCIYLRGELE